MNNEMNISKVEIDRLAAFDDEAPDYYEGEITLYGRFANYNDAHNTISAIVNALTMPVDVAPMPEGTAAEAQARYDVEAQRDAEYAAGDGLASDTIDDETHKSDMQPDDDKREFGKPAPGRKRRTKAEMAEDDAIVAAGQSAEAATQASVDQQGPRLGRSKTGGEGQPSSRRSRPEAPPAPAEEPEITDFDMYGAASQGAAILGAEAVLAIFATFGVKDAAAIGQDDRQVFLDEIKNQVAAAQG